MREVRYDDLVTLHSMISEEFGDWSESQSISRRLIRDFADMTGDQQWIHVDVERAQSEGPFDDVIAHGFLILGMSTIIKNSASYLVVGHSNTLNYGLEKVRFVSPVLAGSEIHGRTRLCSVTEEKGGVMLLVEVAIHVVGAEKPAVIFQWKLLYR
jgi:acyl dehydratase